MERALGFHVFDKGTFSQAIIHQWRLKLLHKVLWFYVLRTFCHYMWLWCDILVKCIFVLCDSRTFGSIYVLVLHFVLSQFNFLLSFFIQPSVRPAIELVVYSSTPILLTPLSDCCGTTTHRNSTPRALAVSCNVMQSPSSYVLAAFRVDMTALQSNPVDDYGSA